MGVVGPGEGLAGVVAPGARERANSVKYPCKSLKTQGLQGIFIYFHLL